MKRLNNKGFTTIEVILCFVLVVIITTSLYTTITSFNQKRITEEYKSKIYTYKNLLTKEIQDDILKKGLLSAEVDNTSDYDYFDVKSNPTFAKANHFKLTLFFKDGSTKTLLVIWRYAESKYRGLGEADPDNDDYYMIKYGSGNDQELIQYPLPELGEYKYKTSADKQVIVKDLGISHASAEINNNILKLYIGLYHPELGYRYSINLICPINYIDTGSTQVSDI